MASNEEEKMEITIHISNNQTIAFCVPDTEDEATAIEKLGRIGEPLEAVVEQSPVHKHPHIKITNRDKTT